MESGQVKFWFQNWQTQMKVICNNCGGPTMLGEVSLEEQHFRIENALLTDELDRVCALAGKFLGTSATSMTTAFQSV